MAASVFVFAAALWQLCHGVMSAPAPDQNQQPLSLHGTPPSIAPTTPEKTQAQAQARKLHGRFLHVTDFHPDEFYKVHSSTAADRACHSGSGPAGTYGAETSDCDAPIALVDATFDWIKDSGLRDEIDFVIWTGDSARHDSDEDVPRSTSQVLGTNRLLADKFAETFSDGKGLSVPVIPTFGNNDILPHNVLMPGPNKWLAHYADIWRKFIPEEQHHSFEFGGWFYVEVIPNKLAVFSLNTLYFFDRNAAVDDCAQPSEPGFKHMEWLRVQLQYMRERGMKAILMGHVPPARTDSKTLWDETCWQKYTLWLQQYRDVVITGLYGHMNIDHFLLLDTKEINIKSVGAESEDDTTTVRENLDDELSIQSATDYLEELRDGWARLPKPELRGDGVEAGSGKGKKKKKKGKKGKKGKKDKNKKKLGGEWAERYNLAFVSPSIVPNYFPTLRVFDYNITGLENAVTWADYTTKNPSTMDASDVESEETAAAELELRDLHDVSDDDLPDFEAEKSKKKHKKGKGKKGRKGKKPKKGKDPNLVVPKPPAKSSPPGPAYSPQPLTLTGYKQYFANLTHINHLIAKQTNNLETEKWREGKHGDKKPKTKPKPRKFKFEVEYSTYDDKLYNLTDLTVKSFVDLAYRMGQTAKGKSAQLTLPGGDISNDLDDIDANAQELVELVQGGSSLDESDDIDDMVDSDSDDSDSKKSDSDDSIEAEKKKKGKKGKKDKKKKKKKNKAKKLNKTWLHFLKHAFVSTIDEEELKKQSS
ncbi:hypothetical protein VSDG_04857 [Cytospora chrysosperma]|uniref:Endopolyphosphatase n=1 Tax=Cytospora chrysosperma TaxID=252740 RepID=A0A423W3P5_CYTCH|nr:hypothetical protein VSDG_04857 [Valsa sordida]